MKRWLIVAAGVAVLALLVVSLATPVFAQDPGAGDAEPANGTAYEKMHQACTEGDWEAMAEAAAEVHGEEFSGMPCHEATTDAGGSGMMGGGTTGGGMMGSGMMGSGTMGGGMMGGTTGSGMMGGGMMGGSRTNGGMMGNWYR